MGHKIALAFGSFDGLHLGHQAVLKALTACEQDGYKSVLAIYPVKCRKDGLSIFSRDEEDSLLKAAGIKELFRLPSGLCRHEQTEKLSTFVLDKYRPELLFGGELPQLFKEAGIKFNFVKRVTDSGKAVSAAQIRSFLSEGKMDAAARLLGRPYSISGRVVHGKALGRTIGMPTANLLVTADKLLPAHGVYGSRAFLEGKNRLGLTHIGPRPSVDNESRISIETFFVDFKGHIYDKELSIDILFYLRPILKLPGLEAVGKQVKLDIVETKRLYGLMGL